MYNRSIVRFEQDAQIMLRNGDRPERGHCLRTIDGSGRDNMVGDDICKDSLRLEFGLSSKTR